MNNNQDNDVSEEQVQKVIDKARDSIKPGCISEPYLLGIVKAQFEPEQDSEVEATYRKLLDGAPLHD